MEQVNTSGIIPTEFKVLVLPDPVEEKTKGGIIIPQNSLERETIAQTKGVLIALSPIAFTYENFPANARLPQPGDRVSYAKYAGGFIDGKDGKQYRIMNDRDISAVIEF